MMTFMVTCTSPFGTISSKPVLVTLSEAIEVHMGVSGTFFAILGTKTVAFILFITYRVAVREFDPFFSCQSCVAIIAHTGSKIR